MKMKPTCKCTPDPIFGTQVHSRSTPLNCRSAIVTLCVCPVLPLELRSLGIVANPAIVNVVLIVLWEGYAFIVRTKSGVGEGTRVGGGMYGYTSGAATRGSGGETERALRTIVTDSSEGERE